MELNELVRTQNEFDKQHGWYLESDVILDVLESINKDLIGLYGEIGEFSNIIKKLNLDIERTDTAALKTRFNNVKENLVEEIIDILIYLFRLSSLLKMDLTAEYLKKLKINKMKYKQYEIKFKEK
jgi:NTP pyrophosphatase (non-canonical NTP hydrolase)